MSKRDSAETHELEDQILNYLLDHPDASDNLEGIASWWLSRQHKTFQVTHLKRVLQRLVDLGWLISEVRADNRCAFKANPAQLEAIRQLMGR
jgi:hypothetical protein